MPNSGNDQNQEQFLETFADERKTKYLSFLKPQLKQWALLMYF
jgi:hypothetical protein